LSKRRLTAREAPYFASIEDERYRELGGRIIATEQSQLLTDVQRTRWESWRRDRILATGENPWLTIPNAMAELDELAQAGEAGQEQQLSDIRNLLATLELGARCMRSTGHFPITRTAGQIEHQLRGECS
jgi:hypothetical protein